MWLVFEDYFHLVRIRKPDRLSLPLKWIVRDPDVLRSATIRKKSRWTKSYSGICSAMTFLESLEGSIDLRYGWTIAYLCPCREGRGHHGDRLASWSEVPADPVRPPHRHSNQTVPDRTIAAIPEERTVVRFILLHTPHIENIWIFSIADCSRIMLKRKLRETLQKCSLSHLSHRLNLVGRARDHVISSL